MNDKPFLSDIEEIRRRANQNIDQGAVTSGYGRDLNQALKMLNQVLASELVCVLRYKHHYYMAKGIHADPVAQEFLQHATDEQLHADMVSMRITQLGGDPDLNPQGMLTRAVSTYGTIGTLVEMITEDLVAERVVIMWYADIIRWFGDADSTSRRMMEDLLAKEEEHADDLADLLANLDATSA